MRLFVETDGLIGDTLMLTPALRSLARGGAEVVAVVPEGSLRARSCSTIARWPRCGPRSGPAWSGGRRTDG